MSRSYTLGLLLGLMKAAEEDMFEDMPEDLDELGESFSEMQEGGLPRRPKHPEKFVKTPRRLSGRKRRRFVRQRKMPKPLLSA